MRSVVCSLLIAAALIGQSADENKVAIANLRSTLTGIGRFDASRARLSERLADDMLRLADPDHAPSRTVVMSFAEELTGALFGIQLSTRSVNLLQQSILDVSRGSSATFAPAASLRQILSQTGVDADKAQLITRRFMAIGEEIRGPDDVPLRK